MRQAALQSEGGARATGARATVASAPQPPVPNAKELDDALSVASTASLTSHAWSSRAALGAAGVGAGAAAFARADEFASGADAVLRVAANLADTVFAYPLLGSEPAAPSTEQRARVVALEVRSGAAAAVLGAQAAGARVAALVPSQPLPLFLPALFQLARSGRPAVVHLSCAALRSGDLALAGGSFEQLEALQHSGALLLGAASAQELHDLAVVAHVAAARLRKLVVHFFDGARVARERATLSLLTPAALRSVAAREAAAAPLDAVDAAGLDVAQRVQRVMDELFPVLHTQYKVFEYTGARDAELALVVVGDAAAAARQATQYEQMLGRKVGVVHCRLLLPWSHALFAAALPATVQRVCVLENVAREALAMQRGALLSRHVQVFFQSPHWAGPHVPQVTTGVYGGVFRNAAFSAGMARAAIHRLASSPSRRAFVVAKSQELYDEALDAAVDHALPPLDVVFGAPLDVDAPLGSQQFVVWGVDAVEQRAGGEAAALFDAALDVLAANPATRVHSLVTHSTASGGSRPAAALQVRVTPAGAAQSSPFAPVERADVVVVARPQLLEAFDVASTVKRGGKLLVLTGWKTVDDVDESAAFKRAVASRELQLLCVDTDELATRVESHAVAAVAPLVAFLKAAALLDEQVVLALLRARFPEDQHATLASLVAAVWGDTNPIVYPAAAWRDLEPEEDQADLPTLSSVRPAAVNLSTAVAPKKRARRGPEVSTATRTAWQVTFPAAFGAAHRVRDHVTDLVTVTKWERLTPADYSRNVFHVEMDTTGTAIRYNIGEALAVFAHNDEKDVLAFLRTYGVDPEALVTLPVAAKKTKGKDANANEGPSGETLTYFQLFAHVLDIFGRPSKKFYEALLARASEPKDKETLEQLLAPEGKDEYKRRVDETLTFADLLDEFPSARPTLKDLIALVPRIKPRHYSIASSMKMNPTSVHLLIVVHDWTTPSGKHRVGQATRFLSSVKVGQQLSVSVCSSVMKLPKNHADPIVMAGLGTGMAPFRAFIQERAFLRAQGVAVGPIALYFGSRSKKQEYLYGAELDAYERDGLVTLLRCAFSRDQPHKVYIQDKIAEDKIVLADWLLNKNGHFYLCGPTWPVADVRAALMSAFELEGGLDARQAGQQIEKMREQGRYVLEVY